MDKSKNLLALLLVFGGVHILKLLHLLEHIGQVLQVR